MIEQSVIQHLFPWVLCLVGIVSGAWLTWIFWVKKPTKTLHFLIRVGGWRCLSFEQNRFALGLSGLATLFAASLLLFAGLKGAFFQSGVYESRYIVEKPEHIGKPSTAFVIGVGTVFLCGTLCVLEGLFRISGGRITSCLHRRLSVFGLSEKAVRVVLVFAGGTMSLSMVIFLLRGSG